MKNKFKLFLHKIKIIFKNLKYDVKYRIRYKKKHTFDDFEYLDEFDHDDDNDKVNIDWNSINEKHLHRRIK